MSLTKQVRANTVRKPMRQGAPRERIRHSGVAQIGQAQGDHVTEQGATGYRGINPYTGKPGMQSELGNAVAARTQCGPGGSRNVSRAGSQGSHGAPDAGKPNSPRPLWDGWDR
jgi:hypothetical protein